MDARGAKINIQRIILLILLSLCLGSCQSFDNPAAETVTPLADSSIPYRQIASYWGSAILSSYDGVGKNPILYFSVITQPDEFKPILSKVNYPDKFADFNLSKEILILTEWGMYYSGGIKVEVSGVKKTGNQIEISVLTIYPDPKTPNEAMFSSAFDFIAISRQEISPNQPVKFVLINNGIVISTQSIEVQ